MHPLRVGPFKKNIDPVGWPINAIVKGNQEIVESFGVALLEAVTQEVRIRYPIEGRAILFFKSDRIFLAYSRTAMRQWIYLLGLSYSTSALFLADEHNQPFTLSTLESLEPPTDLPAHPLRREQPGPHWFACVDTHDAQLYHAIPHLPRAFFVTPRAGLTYFRVTLREYRKYTHDLLRSLGDIPARRAFGLPHETPALQDEA